MHKLYPLLLGIVVVTWGLFVAHADTAGTSSFDNGLVATILSTGGKVTSLGNSGNLRTKRFVQASEKLYVFDRVVLENNDSSLVLRTVDGWKLFLRGKGFISFTERNSQTGGMTIVVESHRLLSDPSDLGFLGSGSQWLHIIMPFGTIQNKRAKMLLRSEQSQRIKPQEQTLWELVVLPYIHEEAKPLILVQTPSGDTWLAGQESRVIIEQDSPPPAQEPVKMIDYQEDLEAMNQIFRAKGVQ